VHQVIAPEEGIGDAVECSEGSGLEGLDERLDERMVDVSLQLVVEGIVEPQKVEADAAERRDVFREVIGENVEIGTGESCRHIVLRDMSSLCQCSVQPRRKKDGAWIMNKKEKERKNREEKE
jgi:hypothetical protein